MKVAFYAPLKSPAHARPSGDRRIAQHFIAALRLAGCEVELASELRAWEGRGDRRRQADIAAQGKRAAAQLIKAYRQRPPFERPRCWFTYHLYHKAPDWLGPAVSAALGIPYLIAEASVADKQRDGAWRDGYAAALAAVKHARLIFNLNSNDLPGLSPWTGSERIVRMKPFTDLAAPAMNTNTKAAKARLRADLAIRHRLDPHAHWLLCVAMMRADSKLVSYRILADAITRLERADWQLLVVGDGEAESCVRALFAPAPPGRVHFLGRLAFDAIPPLMRAADLLVWPAHNEAFGMAVVEALGCGLPVVAGHSGGIGDIVEHNRTGRLIRQPTGESLAGEIDSLLASPATLAAMSVASQTKFNQAHHLSHAAAILRDKLAAVVHDNESA